MGLWLSLIIVGGVLAQFAIPYSNFSDSPPRNCYPDMIREKDYSTCWETTVFATSNDPFYRWAMDYSIANYFSEPNNGVIGYQRASIWRVTGHIESSSGKANMYSSPDPRVLEDEFKNQSKTLVGVMVVRWGISIRLCLTDSCLFTTPIVRVREASNSYAALLVGIPFRNASENPLAANSSSDLYLDQRAMYLTNFLSSARTSVGLKLSKDRDYFYEGNECNKTRPILFSPDVNVYLGYPSLQCTCRGKTCATGVNLTSLDPNGTFISSNADGCYKGKSYWDFDSFAIGEGYVFHTYNEKKDVHISLNATLSTSFNDSPSTQFPKLEAFTSCAEELVENEGRLDENTLAQTLLTKCNNDSSNGMILNLSAVSGFRTFDRYKNLENPESLSRIFYDKAGKDEKQENVMCGFDQGQAKLTDNLCWVSLEDLSSATCIEQLQRRIKSYADVADVKKLVSKEWKDKSPERAEVSNGIAAALVSIAVALFGICNKEIYVQEQRIYRVIIRRGAPRSWKVAVRLIGLSLVFLKGSFTIWLGLKGVEVDPRIATSKSFMQRLNHTQFVVTITSTVQVVPDWKILAWTSVVALGVILLAAPCVYMKISYLEEKLKA